MRRPSIDPRRRSAAERVGLALVVVIAAAAILGPLLAGHAADRPRVDALLEGPSLSHPLGTDNLGRDIFARVLVATRLSLALALGATAVGAAFGVVLGGASLAQRFGAPFAALLGVLVAFPSLLLALFFAVIFGASAVGAMLAVGFAMGPIFGRLVQTLGASVVAADHVSAARLLGMRPARILTRYVLPNVAAPLLVSLTLAAGGSLVVLSELSFLGVGVQVPSYDWGQLLQAGLPEIYTSPAAALGPAAAILLVGLTFNLLGETLGRDRARATATAPRSAGRRSSRAGVLSAAAVRDPGLVADVRGLTIGFADEHDRPLTVVRDVSFTVARGERVGLVGESGSGKSLTALALAGLAPPESHVTADALHVGSTATVAEAPTAMVFQDAGRALNPVLRIGTQLAEAVRAPRRRERLERAEQALRALKVTEPSLRLRQHPHELSGGTQQRAMIAMALAAEPELLIADEPTTALDVTVQRATLDVLREAVAETGCALLFISHDLAVVASVCDRVLVMYAGRVVEDLPVAALPDGAQHPYTRALLATLPDLDREPGTPLPTIPGVARPADDHRGCPFAERCAHVHVRCAEQAPPLEPVGPAHRAACWLHRDEEVRGPVAPAAAREVGA
ncbi:MAG TPA: dipeptide/oligopeptide/nickel ABC transporter permease/ATP-binding protein [Baekduia sp.]|uniref:dipeptide/oligopeptide/nickel ABC transporter permease/ATP-binding protein n=1 Tax=Baekduia sp. TaxID=2600305 RepID=UPI002D778C75|nr:dipeptide/oligopeptide/nickel ABC transporter permease/ATP-binding protein [Baekduia sp.]HET6509677.1 dipeptide/oligopeptide/nickel ABC transporter permease/ATP-binding protein [Baekduia sp.]